MNVLQEQRANQDIRNVITAKGLKMYEAAEACGFGSCYFSRIMARELPPEKNRVILKAIRGYRKKK